MAPVPPSGLLPTSTPEGIERNLSWLRPHFVDDDGNLVLSIHALCVESQGRKIVVDTCIGNDRVIPGYEYLQVDTPFLQNLVDAGFPREEVDFVICTHLHFDHVGWNTMLVDGEWVPTFPNARYIICREEWEHWSTEGEVNYALTLDDAVRVDRRRRARRSRAARSQGHRRHPARAHARPHSRSRCRAHRVER